MPLQIKNKFINNVVINCPEPRTIYTFKSAHAPQGVCEIALYGKTLRQVEAFHRTAICYRYQNGKVAHIVGREGHYYFVSKESLPPGTQDEMFPIVHIHNRQGGLFAVIGLYLNVDSCNFKIRISNVPFQTISRAYNAVLEYECQNLVGVLVSINRYPIFKVDNQPDIAVLNRLYEQFVNYNKSRLDEQLSSTSGRCHIRAHVINTMLNHLGIDSLKVFLKWNFGAWTGFKNERNWSFHCAAMIIDNNNDKWIWDPWIGLKSRLLSFKEWVYYKEFPPPSRVVIANRSVVEGVLEDAPSCLSFDFSFSRAYRNSYQAIQGSAIPNRPEPMLRLSTSSYSFFSVMRRESAVSAPLPAIACSSNSRIFDEQDDEAATSTGLR